MSASPPPQTEPEENAEAEHSGPDQEQPEQTEQKEDGEMPGSEERDLGLAYDAEIKEEDRWLPIANGVYLDSLHSLATLGEKLATD